MSLRACLVVVLTLIWACGDDTASDAGMDAGRDGGGDAGPRDSGRPFCEPVCIGEDLCCATPSGAACTSPLDDIANCGSCGRDCLQGRGTECSAGACVCGRVERGCTGGRRSWCCSPRADGGMHYCANLEDDADDCGACGVECDPAVASECVAGECFCGMERRGCAATDEDTCCVDAVGMFECRDLTSDSLHCGRCGRSCLGDPCVNGNCTTGAACSERCADGDVCCDGVCCNRTSCDRGECGVDGGT